ncbi:MAG: metallophosphoesterase family protein [Lachnospiraceae bacterium]|nr:metallophosphoesterase family protein [Lachnospiraceae bacterium]
MKILAVSDEECPALWDYYVPGRLADYDLILSCGDLKASYLTFLVTMSHARLLYVHGNHDGSYEKFPPEGCENIDGHLVIYNGLRILGLGGSMLYHPGPHQYTEREMARRIARLRRALRRAGGVDIVVTHAPPRGLGDLEDPAHRGFEAFRELIERWHPQILVHGHTHLRYNSSVPRETAYEGTRIVNATERTELEIPDRGVLPKEKNKLIRLTRYREPD